MANTTNFNWETPDDTDLVKDGAAAIRTLGSAIDTSLVDLKGGTTGQVLAKNSNTDMDFIWATDASGIPATIFDAKGDLIVASGADTAARLAVGGTNGHILTVNSGATNGIEWAAPAAGGSLTLINTGGTTLSGSGVTISSIPSTYTNLYIVGVGATNSGDNNIGFRLNGDTGSNYFYRANNNSTSTLTNENGNVDLNYIGRIGTVSAYNNICRFVIEIPRYADTAYKSILSNCIGNAGTTQWWSGFHSWNNTAAITSFRIMPDGGTFSGGTIYVYGVN